MDAYDETFTNYVKLLTEYPLFLIPIFQVAEKREQTETDFIHCPLTIRWKGQFYEKRSQKGKLVSFNYYGKDIEVSEEVYDFLIRDAWREKKRKDRLSRCIAEGGNRCTKKCSECSRTRDGRAFSLEQTMDECQEIAAPDSVEFEVIENETHAEVLASYQELDATDRAILALKHDGYSDRSIAEALGMKQTTVSYRKRKAISVLLERHGEDI